MGNYWSSSVSTWDLEFSRIIKLLDNVDENSNKGTKISQIYGTSPLIPIITECLIKNTTYCIDTNKYVNMEPITLFIVTQKYPSLKKALNPLLKYLVNIKSKYYAKNSATYLNLDTIRSVNNIKNPIHQDLNLKVFSNTSISIFTLCINFIKYGTSSEGIRDNIGTNLKTLILQRYGKSCFACLTELNSWECGHILSVAHGGLTIPENLRPLCFTCNRKMSSMHMYEYIVRNNLPGIKNLTPKTRKMWKAIITLTTEDPRLEKMPVNLRLTAVGKNIISQY